MWACAVYLDREKCPKAVYKTAEMNRVACGYNDKSCLTFESKWIVKTPPTLLKKDQTTLPFHRFNGPAYDPKLDRIRLTGQIQRIFSF